MQHHPVKFRKQGQKKPQLRATYGLSHGQNPPAQHTGSVKMRVTSWSIPRPLLSFQHAAEPCGSRLPSEGVDLRCLGLVKGIWSRGPRTGAHGKRACRRSRRRPTRARCGPRPRLPAARRSRPPRGPSPARGGRATRAAAPAPAPAPRRPPRPRPPPPPARPQRLAPAAADVTAASTLPPVCLHALTAACSTKEPRPASTRLQGLRHAHGGAATSARSARTRREQPPHALPELGDTRGPAKLADGATLLTTGTTCLWGGTNRTTPIRSLSRPLLRASAARASLAQGLNEQDGRGTCVWASTGRGCLAPGRHGGRRVPGALLQAARGGVQAPAGRRPGERGDGLRVARQRGKHAAAGHLHDLRAR